MNEQEMSYKREKRTNILQEKNNSLAKRLSKKQGDHQKVRLNYSDRQAHMLETSGMNHDRIKQLEDVENHLI